MTFKEGQIVTDRDAPAPPMYVTKASFGKAEDVEVKDGTSVADWSGNEKYPRDDPVVRAAFFEEVAKGNFDSTNVQVYSYPESRLKPVTDYSGNKVYIVADDPDNYVKKTDPPEPIEGLGACGYCGSAITADVDDYIEGTDGTPYCDMACYNEDLQ